MNTIQIQKTFYKVGDFLSWQKAGTLELSPDFQRRSVWKTGTKSYLIDTIVRGFPVPIIFLRDKLTDLSTFEPKREVIDGQQRLRTVISYIAPHLLGQTEENDLFTVKRVHNKELAGKSFSELPPNVQRQILDYKFSVHILSSGIDDRTVLQIFRRMNSTNYSLKYQELRNATWFGEFKTSVYDLAAEHLDYWRKWSLFNENNISRMDEVELTSDLCNFILKGVVAGNKSQLDSVYEEKDQDYPEREIVEDRFRTVMRAIDHHLGTFLRSEVSSKKSVIYVIFAWFYTILFDSANLTNKVEAQHISTEAISQLKSAIDALEKNDPEDWLRRPKDAKTRREFLESLGVEVK